VRRLIDHHQRERHARIDAAIGEAGQQLVQEGLHFLPLIAEIGSAHGAVAGDDGGGAAHDDAKSRLLDLDAV
jgi:hypothetical protein